MKKINFWIFALAAMVMFASCGEEKTNDSSSDTKKDESKNENLVCLYSYNDKSSKAEWEAYKTNEKIGVKGAFKTISLGTKKKAAESLDELFVGAAFKAITNSVNTGDAERDKKIVDFFFGNLDDGAVINGIIRNVQGDSKSGTITLEININRSRQNIDMPYKVDENNILSGEFMINIDEFRGQQAVASLNRECDELHTGVDGISKLWPDVKVMLSTQLKVDCR